LFLSFGFKWKRGWRGVYGLRDRKPANGGLCRSSDWLRRRLSELSRLHLIFKLHRVEIEKRKLLEGMVPGSPILSVEQVVVNFKSIAELLHLEVSAQSVEAVIPQGERLLGLGSCCGNGKRTMERSLDYHKDLMIRQHLKELRASRSDLSFAQAWERLRKGHPDLFETESGWDPEKDEPGAERQPQVRLGVNEQPPKQPAFSGFCRGQAGVTWFDWNLPADADSDPSRG
jgi:hypothetical protein